MNGAAAPRPPVWGLMSTMSRYAVASNVVPSARPLDESTPRLPPLIPMNWLVTPAGLSWFVNRITDWSPLLAGGSRMISSCSRLGWTMLSVAVRFVRVVNRGSVMSTVSGTSVSWGMLGVPESASVIGAIVSSVKTSVVGLTSALVSRISAFVSVQAAVTWPPVTRPSEVPWLTVTAGGVKTDPNVSDWSTDGLVNDFAGVNDLSSSDET